MSEDQEAILSRILKGNNAKLKWRFDYVKENTNRKL